MQVISRLDDSAGKADRRAGDVVVLDRLQLPSSRLLLCQNAGRGGINLVEVGRADELLQHRDVRVVRCVQGEALREVPKQAGICSLHMLEHRCVRFERDVDGGGGVLLHGFCLCLRAGDAVKSVQRR